MISNEQIETAIALLHNRCRRQADVLAECEARGIDPNPVMLLVLRRAPRLVNVIRDGELHPGPDTRYVDYRYYGFWAGSPEMEEALDLVLLADR